MSSVQELAEKIEQADPGAEQADYVAVVLISLEHLGLIEEDVYRALMARQFDLPAVEERVGALVREHFDAVLAYALED